MSDFLACLGQRCTGHDLLTLIQKPYGGLAPGGQCFDFSWGSVAVLQERLVGGRNIIRSGAGILAWVGDLVTDSPEAFCELFAGRLSHLQESPVLRRQQASSGCSC